MKLAPFATGLILAATLAVAPGSAAHAQSHTNNRNSSSNKTNQVIQASAPQNFVTVNTGDTLDGIATAHQTTYVRLFDANTTIQDPDVIYPGDKVRIPDTNEQLPDRPLPASTAPAPVSSTPVAAISTNNQPAVSQPATPSLPTGGGAVAGCGDNFYANYIYSHESGCRTTAMSSNDCYGIGQACPASKIAYCGADYACQNDWFTNYANSRYGGWANAYAAWLRQHYW